VNAAQRHQLDRDNLAYGDHLEEVPIDRIPAGGATPTRAWRSRRHLVVLWVTPDGQERLTLQRSKLRPDGQWVDGLTWDDLQRLKAEAGFGDRWAVEIYPPDASVVNVANLRHLWLLQAAPPYAWKRGLA
jgi:hypothetical protein